MLLLSRTLANCYPYEEYSSSGIGLSTVRLLLSLKAKVAVGDINPPPDEVLSKVVYTKVDVTSWDDQKALFKAATEKYGRIDHAFANAGVPPTDTFLEDNVDDKGEPLPPNLKTVQINYIGVIYTVKLAVHHIRKNPEGGSIVLTGSASSFQEFMAPDYTSSKTGVLGVMRGMMHLMNNEQLPIRINLIGPQWVQTNLAPAEAFDVIGSAMQSPDFIARQVALLMADKKRHGHFLFSDMYVVKEIETEMNKLAESFPEKEKDGWVGLNDAMKKWMSEGQLSG